MADLLRRLQKWVFRTGGTITVLAVATFGPSTFLAQEERVGESVIDITSLFPSGGADLPWQPVDSVRVFRGEDLFEFINGGAPIFLEYGFRAAAIQRYVLRSGSWLVSEIYEMEGPASAYGIFTFQNVDMDRGSALGDGAVLEEYYVTFWKGKYLITITGNDESDETQDAMIRLARCMEEGVEGRGSLPELVKSVPTDSLGCHNAVYIRGSLGLYNNFVFDSEDIFGVEEGIVTRCSGATLVVLSYENEATALDWFNQSRGWINGSPRFTELQGEERLLLLQGPGSSRIRIEPFRCYLLLAKGSESEELGSLLQKVKALLRDERQGQAK